MTDELEEQEALYLQQELLVEIKTLIEEINDPIIHSLRQCATLIHDINKGQYDSWMLTTAKATAKGVAAKMKRI